VGLVSHLRTFTAKEESDDVAQMYIDQLEEDIKEIYNQYKLLEDMIFTKDDEKLFDEATICHKCNKDLGEDRVRDHCHISSKFRGVAHNSCNINYKVPKFFPVYFHNLLKYVCMKNYKLDPAWYYTSGLSWDAILKMTGIELELLSDYDMILMIKNGIRGGVIITKLKVKLILKFI